MVGGKYIVVWTKRSQLQMKKAHEFISKDSEQNALKVLEDIVAAVNKAIPNPEFYNPDKYKRDNDGSYRSFELHHLRVSFRYTDDNVIIVLRVRHSKMNPKEY